MNYIRELNAFIDWLEINPLEATTQTLWFHLMAIANKSGWPEWFTVANLTLQAKINGSDKTLIKHRNILVQKGRIEYRSQGKQQAGKYRIISFYEDDLNGNIPLNYSPNHSVNCSPNYPLKGSVLNKLNETKQNKKTNKKDSLSEQVPTALFDESIEHVPKETTNLSKQVKEIFDFYIQTFDGFFPKGITLTADRRKKIEARLKEGYSIEQIKLAISNIRKSSFHCGENDRNKFYADITFICRNGSKIEEWMNYQPRFQPIKKAVGDDSRDAKIIEIKKRIAEANMREAERYS